MSARVSRSQPSRRLVDRVVAAFVEPADDVGEEVAPAVATAPPAVAVLCRPGDAWVAGAVVGLAGRGPAVVAAWGEGVRRPGARGPAARGARRVADLLAGRGHDAVATGRLVHVLLADPADAARVAAAADPAPCVTVLAGPRDDAIDALLRAHDEVLVEADDDVADLALTSLAQADVPARRLTLAGTSSTARALAAAGLTLTPPLRAAAREALG